MSKLTRVFQKVFGSSGSTGDFGQPGSFDTTKTNTKDPATIQGLAAFLSGLTAIVASGTYKLALEDLNSLFLLAFYQIAYLMQAGIAEWNTDTTYYTGSLANVNGSIYTSLSDENIGNNPVTDAVHWALSAGTPVGVIQDFAGPIANIPNGFLLCDGSVVSRSTYANLFAAIGTLWNTGGESGSVFRLPPAGRVSVGYDSTQTEFNTVGKMGGEKTHTLTTSEMPSHVHEVQADVGGGTGHSGASGTVGAGYNTEAAGGDQPHNNLQPYGVMLKIIKY